MNGNTMRILYSSNKCGVPKSERQRRIPIREGFMSTPNEGMRKSRGECVLEKPLRKELVRKKKKNFKVGRDNSILTVYF